jgi:hypothetical protein
MQFEVILATFDVSPKPEHTSRNSAKKADNRDEA